MGQLPERMRLVRPERFTWLVIAGLACGLLVSSGCSAARRKPPERATVSGKVTLDGKPIADGEVIFLALSGEAVDRLPIANGGFQGSVTVGQQRVQFASFTTVKRAIFPDKPPETVRENSLPARFGSESTLTADIKPGDNPPLSFELKSQPSSAKPRP
jgi:hypothetical protein